MPRIFATQFRDARFARRSLILAGVGIAGLTVAAWLPELRTPWFVSLAALVTTVGVLSWAAAGSASVVTRLFVPAGAGMAVSKAVEVVMRGASVREGVARGAVMGLVWVGLLLVLEVSEMRGRRAQHRASPAADRDQWPNDR